MFQANRTGNHSGRLASGNIQILEEGKENDFSEDEDEQSQLSNRSGGFFGQSNQRGKNNFHDNHAQFNAPLPRKK